MVLINLFWEYFKIGFFAVGGGMATIPFLLHLNEKFPNWFSLEELTNMIAVSESTPGPIGVNVATFVGHKVYGILGSIVATFGLIAPAFIIIVLISKFLMIYWDKKEVKSFFSFIKPVAIALIFYAFTRLFSLCLVPNGELQIFQLVIFAVFFVLIYFLKKIHPIIWIILGALFGIFFL